MDWHEAVNNFWQSNQLKPWLRTDKVGNLSFEAIVKIRGSSKSCTERTRVRIIRNGIDDGTIKIAEAGALTLEDYHTEYKPIGKSQCRYRPSKNSILLSGSSAKLGAYEVEISPNIDA